MFKKKSGSNAVTINRVLVILLVVTLAVATITCANLSQQIERLRVEKIKLFTSNIDLLTAHTQLISRNQDLAFNNQQLEQMLDFSYEVWDRLWDKYWEALELIDKYREISGELYLLQDN